MTSKFRRPAVAFITAASVAVGLAFVTSGPAQAAASDVVINEIMYNAAAAGPNPTLEFLELHNRGGTAVDVSGWRITDAFTLTNPGGRLPAGTTIPAGGYFLISGDAAAFAARFPGVTPDAYFDPVVSGLAGGGEIVTLADSADVVIDSVTYDDVVPWPIAPDGGGPSLELIDPFSDNAVGPSWAASTGTDGTPQAQNSVFNAPPPSLNITATPFRPNPGQAVTVQASAPGASAATLTYKVMFGSDVSVAMTDGGGGTFSAVIPGQAAGNLIRFKVSATVGAGTLTHPVAGDSRGYDGVVVTDSSLNSAQLPVLEWFIDDAGYNGLLQPFCDQVEYPGVITWQGQVFDNANFRRRGHTSCNDPKPKIEMQLPAGYAIDFSSFASGNAAPFTGPLDEWALQNEAYPIPGLGWENIRQVGDPAVGYMPVRVQRNGAFFGASMILEEYDGSWRSRKGYDNGAFYKVEAGGLRTYSTPTELYNSADFDKKDPDDTDYTDVWQLTQMLSQPSSPAKTAWIYANLDVPQIVNYTALTVALRHWDSGGKNFYLYRGTGNTDRWQILHWDLDGIFSGGSDSKGDFVTPDLSFNKLYASIFEIPAIREMHFRRLRTLHDQYLVGNGFVNQFDALTVGKDADRVLNKAKWGGPTLSTSRNKVVNGVQERRNQIAAHTNANEVPTSQSANPAVVINEIHYKPGTATGSEEFLELYNPSTTEAVDISGWRLKGLGSSDAEWPIPPGTVIPKGGYVVFVSVDSAFRGLYGPDHFVGGQFPGGLSSSGEQIQLLRGATVVDQVTYSSLAPWPTTPNGTGPSLELKNPTLDNADPANWAASTNTGTPNTQNTAFGGGGPGPGTGCAAANPSLDFGDTWCYLATGGDQGTAWRAEAFVDSTWPTGAGALGFKNTGLTTTIPSTNGRTTYYFRTKVDVADTSTITSATLNTVLDDGAVVYVNGVEATRTNLPAGTIGFTQKALVDITGAAENTPVALNLPTNLFHNGTNTIAIEVHNKGNSPGDLGLNAELRFNTGGGGPGGTVVLDYGSAWKYKDDGVDQGTAWRAPAFVDTGWASGPSMLGFQNSGVVTTLARVQQRTTYYFRSTFQVTTPAAATLEMVRDDGAVIYVNGVEVARSNMPAGAVTFSTKASSEITGSGETTSVSIPIPQSAFVVGTNSIAIEVHQNGNAAGDLSMDTKLTVG